MKLEIKEIDVLNNKKEKKEFINLPWILYKDDSNWVPPLKLALNDLLKPSHPFYQTGKIKSWMAYKKGTPVGRVMAIVNNHYNEYTNEKCGFFGFLEASHDPEIFEVLFKEVEKYLHSEGLDKVQGPMNPSTNYECGLLVDGFNDPPQIMMTYNPNYYNKELEKLGYQKSMDLLAYRIKARFEMPRIIDRISKRAEKSARITYRKVSKKNWNGEVDLMMDLYNSAWEKNWGFIPMTKEEFYHTAKDLRSVVNEDFVLFVEVNGDPAGFIVALPDFNQVFAKIPSGKLLPTGIFKLLRADKHINRLRVITMGIKQEYQKLGLASLLYKKCHENILNSKNNYDEIEMSWILESNRDMNRPLEVMGAEVYKRYRIFEKSLL